MMAPTKWNIGIVQMDCTLGEIDPNLKKIAHFATLAKELGAQIVVYPECATTGYFVVIG
jgi:predicted amidohydrolase